MQLTLDKIGKRFQKEWIFRNVCLSFFSGKSYAITGNNGSGKSTLLQVIAGIIPSSEGTISLSVDGKNIAGENLYSFLSIATPYMELIEELTLSELVDFHIGFKPLTCSKEVFIDQLLGLEHAKGKEIRNYSSGMKQKVKLGLALFSKSQLILLDEPTSNLDLQNIEWYNNHLKAVSAQKDKLIIICSNIVQEYDFCDEIISVNDYKKKALKQV